ncbi:MAG: hypothetical protein CMI15_03180 [Opitutaceae bacterium]|nr:hypothetical protein [Opitutaceae bacterium]
MLHRFAISTVVLLYAGCQTTYESLRPDEVVSSSQGVFLASITTDRHEQVLNASFHIEGGGLEGVERVHAFEKLGILGKRSDFPDEKELRGRLVAISLPPGQHGLNSWCLNTSNLIGISYMSPKADRPKLPFTISSGEVTYLGNLHLNLEMAPNEYGLVKPVAASPRIQVAEERDLEIFYRKFPNIASWKVDTIELDGESWRVAEARALAASGL